MYPKKVAARLLQAIDTVCMYLGLGVVVTMWFVIVIQYVPFWLLMKGCQHIKNDFGNNLFDDELWAIQGQSVESAAGGGTGSCRKKKACSR